MDIGVGSSYQGEKKKPLTLDLGGLVIASKSANRECLSDAFRGNFHFQQVRASQKEEKY